MRYLILALALLVSGCIGRDGQGRVVASSTTCGPMGPITGCPGYKSDPPMGGEVRVRTRYPNYQCSITSDRLGVDKKGRPLVLTTKPMTLPHGPFGASRPVRLEVDCCDMEGKYRGFYLDVVPRDQRDLVVPDSFQSRSAWAPNLRFCRELGLLP
ncbi:hypothetical protein K8Q93_01090 [Candidatus Parcubacteria bacterium]|nr:hypothetical protein [Candidatus Parcubacteria bacterium]